MSVEGPRGAWSPSLRSTVAAWLRAGCAVALGASLIIACARPPRPGGAANGVRQASTTAVAPATSAPLTPPTRPSVPLDPERVWAVVINGGAEPASNYQSHLLHVRAMLEWLESAGVPRDQVAVFSSDGDDPGADLAVRELRPSGDVQLLDGTKLDARLGRPIEYVSTSIDGVALRPATQASLGQWFATDGAKLGAGDTIFVYVTDHGTRGKLGPEETKISLWNRESITVRELDTLLAKLPPGVRVVSVMSQCFSGGFARLGRTTGADGEVLPSGRACGYFSSTETRLAYGCYPENRGKDNIGHAVRFIESLALTGDLPASHERTLVLDRTPDVPLRSSDVQLELLLESAAKARGTTVDAYADELLAEAWRDPASWEHEIRLLDRIGQSFGVSSPRSIAEVNERLAELPQAADPLKRYSAAWKESLSDLSQANLDRFLASQPGWRERTADASTKGLDAPALRDLGDELIAELGPFTRADGVTEARLGVLRERATAASGASYRMEVREAAFLRMRAGLLSIAGQVHLATRASAREREAVEALMACEDVSIGPAATSPLSPTLELSVEPDLPPFADDVRVARDAAPAWMGISFQPVAAQKRPPREGLPAGAVSVREVMPDSPAERAGLEVGDVILGPTGKPFAEPRQVREWTMLRTVGEPASLDVLRDQQIVVKTIVPDVHPGKFPEMPGPPQIGTVAPKLELDPYRGELPGTLASGEPHILFFWATWCLPCKASLPELFAFARERGVAVIAISDEDRESLDEFFAAYDKEFPAIVARDPKRRTYRAYGASGTPTFVLVDGEGKVQSTSTGYSHAKGLGVPGWRWSGGPAVGSAPGAGAAAAAAPAASAPAAAE